jgi:hypothetical protein
LSLNYWHNHFTLSLLWFCSCLWSQVRVVSWLPATTPVAVVLVSHGLHEHALRYYDMAHYLAARGVAVYACDHYAHGEGGGGVDTALPPSLSLSTPALSVSLPPSRLHFLRLAGKSDGTRGLITDWHCLIEDFVAVAEHVHKEDGNAALPFSLLAHSLGTLVAVLSINRLLAAGLPLAGVLFSGTPLVAGPGASSPFGCQCLYPLSQTAVAGSMAGCLAGCDPKGPAAPILVDGECTHCSSACANHSLTD